MFEMLQRMAEHGIKDICFRQHGTSQHSATLHSTAQYCMGHSKTCVAYGHVGTCAHVAAHCSAAQHGRAQHCTAKQAKMVQCCVDHLWSLPFTEGSMACASSDRNVLGLPFPSCLGLPEAALPCASSGSRERLLGRLLLGSL